ncbi:MAG: 16S rRNA (cytosine(967)-C(5))-methyltransferase RsmB, partial [Oscillospiraceae bacterium]|nr:16S rRNA (cytosine(967)-C(5))-methyltransferase RsmB [Oscillospiraceae bacterium]
MKSSRQIAFEVLMKIYKDNAYSNLAIDSKLLDKSLQDRDKAFVTALTYGVTERKITIDYILSLYLKQPIKKLKPAVLTILRMGTYQIFFMDKIPVSAAINESVELSKKNNCSFAGGLINAVLKKAAQDGIKLPDYNKDKIKYYSVKYSCPKELAGLWIDSYGEENAQGLMSSSIGAPPIVIRVNTLKTCKDELALTLEAAGISFEKCTDVPDALIIKKAGDIEKINAYKQGLFHVQDTASQLCCKAVGAVSDSSVIDMCAAPGGKSFTIAQYMNNKGHLMCFDLYDHRTSLIKQGAQRLGISIIKTEVRDARIFESATDKADRVLCDVPCSGFGII